MGSEVNLFNIWFWVWENINGFDDKIIFLVRSIKEKGEKLNLEFLINVEIDIIDELNGYNFLIVVCGFVDENYCYYCGLYLGGVIFVVFNGVDEKVFFFVDVRKFIDIIMRSI